MIWCKILRICYYWLSPGYLSFRDHTHREPGYEASISQATHVQLSLLWATLFISMGVGGTGQHNMAGYHRTGGSSIVPNFCKWKIIFGPTVFIDHTHFSLTTPVLATMPIDFFDCAHAKSLRCSIWLRSGLASVWALSLAGLWIEPSNRDCPNKLGTAYGLESRICVPGVKPKSWHPCSLKGPSTVSALCGFCVPPALCDLEEICSGWYCGGLHRLE